MISVIEILRIYGLHPAYWLSAFALGVRWKGPSADRALLIEPHCGQLTHCEGVVVTEYGPVPIKWIREDSGLLRVEFTVPDGIRATVRIRRRQSGAVLLVDGRKQSAALTGNTLSIDLGTGRHTVAQLP